MRFDDIKSMTNAGFALTMYDIVNGQTLCRICNKAVTIPGDIAKFDIHLKGHSYKCIKLEDLKPNVTE